MARVLLVGKGAPERGGIPTFVDLLLDSDLARRHELRFLNLTPASPTRGGSLSLSNITRTFRDALRVHAAAAHADVVHFHSALAPGVTLLRAGLILATARLRGTRVLAHAHGGLLVSWARSRLRRSAVRLCLAPAHEVYAVSAQGAEVLAGLLGARVRHLPNGVDVGRFAPGEPAQGPPKVLFVGLLTPRKGVVDLIEASTSLQAAGVAHELWLVGGTPDEGPEAEQVVREAARGTAVRLLGPQARSAMPDLYRQAHVFCLPSWWEAMPFTVLEAMACGLPVVATAVGDVPNMVEPGRTGLLVAPRSPDDLAAALARVLQDDRLRGEMGAAGRQRCVARFALERTIGELATSYEKGWVA